MVEWYEFVAVVISFVIGLICSKVYYRKFKKALHEAAKISEDLTLCIKSIENALEDDNITKEEVKTVWRNCKQLIEELRKIFKK